MGRKNKRSNKNQTKVSTNDGSNRLKDSPSAPESNVNGTNNITPKTDRENRIVKTSIELITNTEQQDKIVHFTAPNESIEVILSELKMTKSNSNQKFSNKINKRGRDFFISCLCQVCKQSINDNENCKKCHMITYCSPEHRRLHWPMHAGLCGAIQEICKAMDNTHILEDTFPKTDADSFRSYCYQVMLACEKNIQRKLEEWEVELLLFPRVCLTCQNYNKDELEYCSECRHCSYCRRTPQHLPLNHKKYCHSLILYRKILQYQYENGLIKTVFPETNFMNNSLLEAQNIDDILKESKTNLDELNYIQLTESATSPLTVVYSKNLVNDKNNNISKKSLTIHVIGAEKQFELNQLQKWEIFFLHYFNTLKTLNIIFVGPEMKINNKEEAAQLKNITLCEKCSNHSRQINFEFYDKTFYHDYVLNTKDYKQPDIICAFNAGLYRTTGYNESDTWPDTIKAMFKIKSIPVLITAYTLVEILKDVKRVQEIQKCEVIKTPCQNPFSSQKPNLNFVSYEDVPVIYKNYYLAVLKN